MIDTYLQTLGAFGSDAVSSTVVAIDQNSTSTPCAMARHKPVSTWYGLKIDNGGTAGGP